MQSIIINKKIYNLKTSQLIDKVCVGGFVFAELYEKKTGELFVAYVDKRHNYIQSVLTNEKMIDSLSMFDASKISDQSLKYHHIEE